MKFTLFTHDENPTGKRFWLGKDGSLKKQTNGILESCKAVVMDVGSLSELESVIQSCDYNNHLCAGVSGHQQAKVVTVKTYDGLTDTSGVITRTNKHISFRMNESGLMTIDVDGLSYEQALSIIFQAQPELQRYAHLMCSSSSSHIMNGDVELKGGSGCHIYFHVKNAADIPNALQVLHQRIVAMGLGSSRISTDGKFLDRSVVDLALCTPCQPIYLHARCKKPLEQKKQYYLYAGEELLDTRKVIPDLSAEEQEAYVRAIQEAKERLKPEMDNTRKHYVNERVSELVKAGVDVEIAKETITASMEGQALYPDFVVKTIKGNVSVRDILKDSKHWHRVACSDPVEPSYGSDSIAIIYSEQSRPIIHSFAHNAQGKTYYLEANKPSDDIPELIPLGSDLLPVQEFNPDLLPDEIQGWVVDIAKRVQCPIDFVAVGSMIALSSLIAGKVSIYPKQKDNWRVVPNLWGCLIGRPSSMKTPAMEVLKPLKKLEQAKATAFEFEQKMTEAEGMEIDAKLDLAKSMLKKAIKEQNDTSDIKEQLANLKAQAETHQEASAKRYVVNDSTHEKLGELLCANPHGLLLERDELAGLFASLNREDRQEARAFFLEAFNGTGSYTFDRIGRGTVVVEKMVLSLMGGIQPGKLAPFIWNAISQGHQDDGLIQRLQLAVYPDIDKDWTNFDEYPCEDAESKAFDVFQRLDAIKVQTEEGLTLRFTPKGQEVFNDWRKDLEDEARTPDIHPAIEAHLIKYRSLMPSIALLIHATDNGIDEPVSESAAMKAVLWCDYLKSHMLRIYGGAVAPELINAHTILNRRDKLPERFTIRDVQRKNWAGLSNKQDIECALEELIDTNHIRSGEVKRANHTVKMYDWNPKLKNVGKQ